MYAASRGKHCSPAQCGGCCKVPGPMQAAAPTPHGGCCTNYNTVIPRLQVSLYYAIIIVLCERKEEYYGTRKTAGRLRLTPWLHPCQRGLCHRHRQRLALPHRHRPVRRRYLCLPLPDFPGADGPAGSDHGTGRRPRRARCRPQRLQGAGTTGQQVAHPRLVLHGGLYTADDVLHHRLRLDARLLLPLPDRQF